MLQSTALAEGEREERREGVKKGRRERASEHWGYGLVGNTFSVQV